MMRSTSADARTTATAVATSLVLLACVVGLAAAAGRTTVGLNPEQDTVSVGKTTTIRVVVDTV